MKAEVYPSLYRLAWLKQSSEIKVSRCALVLLSISTTHKDDIYCDIVPMDGYHILLGRPWQFDRNVVHNGKNNTHSFYFENRKIILVTSKELTCADRSPPLDSKPAMFLSRSRFETELHTLSHVVYGCVLCCPLELTKVVKTRPAWPGTGPVEREKPRRAKNRDKTDHPPVESVTRPIRCRVNRFLLFFPSIDHAALFLKKLHSFSTFLFY